MAAFWDGAPAQVVWRRSSAAARLAGRPTSVMRGRRCSDAERTGNWVTVKGHAVIKCAKS